MIVLTSGDIHVFWWSERHLQGKSKENYGDLVGKYLVEKISGRNVIWKHPKKFHLTNFWKPTYVTAGSILAHINKQCVVWGSGIISKDHNVKDAKEFLAVRGPHSHERLTELGYEVPEVFGDPALLMPKFFTSEAEKKYKVGIIPHYVDYETVNGWYSENDQVHVIDLMTNDIEEVTTQILQCEYTLSSSLHGVIVSHAYNIPSVRVAFSDKIFGDGIKYLDYLASVALENYQPALLDRPLSVDELRSLVTTNPMNLPDRSTIEDLQEGLMAVCPFKQ